MNATEDTQQTRLLPPAELAVCIRMFREMRQWSQEQLAEISGLNVRTIQRVEQGLSASLHTRRALASAFEFEDIRGMAWDMTLLRVLEKNATASRLGSFFIPYFVSIDRRWRHLLHLNPVAMMLIDDAHRRVLFARADELEFQRILGECVQTELQAEMTPEKVEARRRSAQAVQLDATRQLAAEEERLWLENVSQQSASETA